MLNVTLPTSVARKLAADTFLELPDSGYQTLLMRVMSEGRYRKNLDVARLHAAFTKAFGKEDEKPATSQPAIDEF